MQAHTFDNQVSEPVAPIAKRRYRVAVVDDCRADAFVIERALRKSGQKFESIDHFSSISELLMDYVPSPDVVILDRMMPDSVLAEARIREVRARHCGCGVVINTSQLTPSLRSTAAHEGAVAVIEKGTLSSEAIGLLVMSAAVVGEQIAIS